MILKKIFAGLQMQNQWFLFSIRLRILDKSYQERRKREMKMTETTNRKDTEQEKLELRPEYSNQLIRIMPELDLKREFQFTKTLKASRQMRLKNKKQTSLP
jgi:hypothetical protein